ncbi:LysR family transcriptional regulator [Pseudonocardia kujensis]|uniref:LysR family transcriptional regulator n=1 Tax=Pseudonocardia kujensis TaxID=1128675 RepID=UPI001E3C2CCB|nr:LysR family transcriptional regulator [Pseudonocardia kujensis]MCE0766032.1 LysR family transcriptional regulator [Pseudonocardia kujensis]
MNGRRRQALERLTLAEIEAFVAVAELGSFTTAAKRLHLTQPATSNRIQRLEATLGTRLLARTTRRVELTDAGERLLAGVDPLLDQLDILLGGFLPHGDEATGRVVLASTPHLATSFLHPALQTFQARHASVEVVVLDLEYDDVLAAVDDGEADLALLTARATERPGAVELGSDEVVLVVPPAHPLRGTAQTAVAALADLEILVIRPYREIVEQLSTATRAATGGRAPRIRWMGSLTTLFGLIDTEGAPAALMTRHAAARHGIAAERQISVAGVDIRRHYSLFSSRYSAKRTSVALLRRHLEASLPFRST